jgi:AraC family transcriptional regulator
MRDLLPIHQAIDFIEAHLQDEITVGEMANAAGYSLYHFIRTFNQVVWHTPYDYLIRRRLCEAARDLIARNRRVLDIALNYRFNNHETFSRAFKRLFGIQPIQWRERAVIPPHALMPALSLAYLEHIHRPDFQRPRLMTVEPRHLAGLMTALAGQPDVAAQLWRDLGQALQSNLPELPGQGYFAVTSYLNQQSKGAYYLVACELASLEKYPPMLVSQTLPAGDYICITHHAPLISLSHTLAYLYHTWLPKARLQPAYPIEIVAHGAIPPWRESPEQVEIWLPVEHKEIDGQYYPNKGV